MYVSYMVGFYSLFNCLVPLGRKQLQFSTLNAQETVRISEFEVTHRDLYTPTDRLPVKDGVLDRRLVCSVPIYDSFAPYPKTRGRQKRTHTVKRVASLR